MPINKQLIQNTRYPGIQKLGRDRYLVRARWTDQRTGEKHDNLETVEGTIKDALTVKARLSEEQDKPKPSRQRFADYAKKWLKRHCLKHRLAPSTRERYTVDVAHLIEAWGQWWVDAIDVEAVDEWQLEVAERYSPSTINSWHRTLRLVLDRARQQRLVSTNAAREVQALQEGRTKGARGNALDAEEFRRFIGAVADLRGTEIASDLARQILLIAWTGMRLGETRALRFSDIVNGEIRVERSVWHGQEKADKTDDPRRITVVDEVRVVLDEQRQWLLSTQHPGLASGLVFPGRSRQAKAGKTRRGEDEVRWYRSPTALRKPLDLAASTAKVARISPHGLRRTFEDLLREAGVEEMVRRAVAGWRTEKAQGIYATVSRRDRDAAAAAVVKLVRGEK